MNMGNYYTIIFINNDFNNTKIHIKMRRENLIIFWVKKNERFLTNFGSKH